MRKTQNLWIDGSLKFDFKVTVIMNESVWTCLFVSW